VELQNEQQEWPVLNWTRMWFVWFNLDRSMATQFGELVTIKDD
jgi:hypothetical protein